MELERFTDIDWDDDEDPLGNLAHCRRAGRLGGDAERIVYEVLSEEPVEVRFVTQSAEFAVVGPDRSRSTVAGAVRYFSQAWGTGFARSPVGPRNALSSGSGSSDVEG